MLLPCMKHDNVISMEPNRYTTKEEMCIISHDLQRQSPIKERVLLPNECGLGCNLTILVDESPSTSTGFKDTKYHRRDANLYSTESTESLSPERIFLDCRKKLLSDLLLNVRDEELYVSLLMKLVEKLIFDAKQCLQKFSQLT